MRALYVPGDLNPHEKHDVKVVALVPENVDEAFAESAILEALSGDAPALLAVSTRAGDLTHRIGTYFGNHPEHWATTTIAVRSTLAVSCVPQCAASLRSIVTVDHRESAVRMRQLWRFVEPRPGPASGLAFAGLMKHLDKWFAAFESNISTSPYNGDIRRHGCTAAFLCTDLVASRPK